MKNHRFVTLVSFARCLSLNSTLRQFQFMKRNLANIVSTAAFGALLFFGGALNQAHAQTSYTWNGGGTSGNWSDGNNWGGSGPSNPQGYLNFDGSTRVNNTNNFSAGGPGFQFYFKSSASTFNLYGNSVIFYDFGGANPNIQNEGTANTQTINFPIIDGNTSGANGILNINGNAGSAPLCLFLLINSDILTVF